LVTPFSSKEALPLPPRADCLLRFRLSLSLFFFLVIPRGCWDKKDSHECMRICIHMNKNKMLSISFFWKKVNQTLDMKARSNYINFELYCICQFSRSHVRYILFQHNYKSKQNAQCTQKLWNDIEMWSMLFSLETVLKSFTHYHTLCMHIVIFSTCRRWVTAIRQIWFQKAFSYLYLFFENWEKLIDLMCWLWFCNLGVIDLF
jgi:hypothetical protein